MNSSASLPIFLRRRVQIAAIFFICGTTLGLTPAAAQNQVSLRCSEQRCTLSPSETPLFSVTQAVPGESYEAVMTAKNTRKDACALRVALEQDAYTNSLPLEQVFIAVKSATGDTYLGALDQGKAQPSTTLEDVREDGVVFGYLPPKESDDFIWNITINPQLTNEYQGSTLSFDLNFHITCDDPARILPTPTPHPSTPSPTPISSSSEQNLPPVPSVLGASSTAPECATTDSVDTFTISRKNQTTATLSWESSAPMLDIAYFDHTTNRLYRLYDIHASHYTFRTLAPTHSYSFWLEQQTECAEQQPLVTPLSLAAAVAPALVEAASASTESAAVLGEATAADVAPTKQISNSDMASLSSILGNTLAVQNFLLGLSPLMLLLLIFYKKTRKK